MVMRSLKERIEQNVAIWFMAALLTGFLSGFGAYRAIQEIAGLKAVSVSTIEDSARKLAAMEKEVASAQTRAAEATVQVKQAYGGLLGSRVGVMYIEPESRYMLKIKARLVDVGAIVTPNEVSQWRGYPEYVGRLLYRKGAEEAAYQVKALVSDLAVATPRVSTELSEPGEPQYDVVLWIQPRK